MSNHFATIEDVSHGGPDAWRPRCGCGWVGRIDSEGAATQEGDRHTLKERVLAFAQNKMHAPWLKALGALFEVTP